MNKIIFKKRALIMMICLACICTTRVVCAEEIELEDLEESEHIEIAVTEDEPKETILPENELETKEDVVEEDLLNNNCVLDTEDNESEGGESLLAKSSFAPANEHSTGGFVTRMYKIVLGRNPDQKGYDYWVGSLNSGNSAASDIVTGFFFSNEYQNKNKNNGAIVNDLYSAMLNRTPDNSGYNYWLQRLDVGMTPRAIIKGFVGSREFTSLCNNYGIKPGSVTLTQPRDQNYEITYFVYRLYCNCLSRRPDSSGLDHWCKGLLEGKSGTDVAYEFVFSKEYLKKHTENEDFTEMLYRTILGRASDSAGKNSWVTQLNYTNTREHVFNGFLVSKEFKEQCSKAGISIGNPVEEPDSGIEWQYNVEILRLCNEQRKTKGLIMLVTREDLWRDVAMVRATELIQLFSHSRPNGTSCWTAYEEAGIEYASAENIAAGYTGSQDVVNGWMNSSGHRDNILGGSRVLATGYKYNSDKFGFYYCQNFLY